MRQPAIRRWITNGVALAGAMALTFVLAGHIAGTGAGNIAGTDTTAVTPATPPHEVQTPAVQLAAGSDFLDFWGDVLRSPSDAVTNVVAPTRTDGIHSIVRAVVPQLLPDNLSDRRRNFITAGFDRLASPLSNLIADSRLGAYISLLVTFGNSAAAFVDDVSGDNPDAKASMLDLMSVPGDLLGGYHNGANLNLGPLVSTLTNAGMFSEGRLKDIDPDSLYIGFGGNAAAKSATLGARFPRIGAYSQIARDVSCGFAPSPLCLLAGR
jgi:hypothetical protein